jgi:flagellar motor switch protein FliG
MATQTADEQLSGPRKAAVLLVQMGREASARILAEMRETEVEEIMAEIVRLQDVESTIAEDVLTEFHDMVKARAFVGQGGFGFARDLLSDSLGDDRAGEILSRISAAVMEMPFQFLHKADPRQLLSFLQDEHPQTIALVLAHMTADQASMVLSGLPAQLQADVAHRIAVMDRTSPEIIKSVEATLERKLSSVLQPADLSEIGGLQPLVDIINRADRATERLILEGLEGRDPALAEEVRSRMFMFEDITGIDDRSIQLVLRQVETNDLATALKGVRADVRDKVMKNLSERAAANLADEIEMLGPVRLSTVEEAQVKVVQAIRVLEESGQIVISRGGGGEDEFVA